MQAHFLLSTLRSRCPEAVCCKGRVVLHGLEEHRKYLSWRTEQPVLQSVFTQVASSYVNLLQQKEMFTLIRRLTGSVHQYGRRFIVLVHQ